MDTHRDLDKPLLEHALAAIAEATGLEAAVTQGAPTVAGPDRADAHVTLRDGTRTFDLVAEVKPRVDRRAALDAAQVQIQGVAGDRGLLVTRYLTPELAQHCRQIGQQFVDAAGNAYLRLPGLHVQIQGRPRPHLPEATTRGRPIATTTGQRVVFLLLCKADYLNAPQREIARAAGVALGAVGRVFQDLADQKYIIGRPGAWRYLEPLRLLDHWTTLYPTVLRPRLHARRFTTDVQEWWQQATLDGTGGLWGGEVAADRITHHLKPAAFTLYAPAAELRTLVAALAQRHRWRADPQGEIEVLETFWNFPADPAHPDVVPAPLIYADLLATVDPRNREVAQLLRATAIEKALRPA